MKVHEALNLYKLHSNPKELTGHNEFQTKTNAIGERQFTKYIQQMMVICRRAEDDKVIKLDKADYDNVYIEYQMINGMHEVEIITYTIPKHALQVFILQNPKPNSEVLYKFLSFIQTSSVDIHATYHDSSYERDDRYY